MKSRKFTKLLFGAALLLGALTQVQADDTKVDPSGTYIWTIPARGGGTDRTNTLVLKADGDKLTGKLSAPGRGGVVNDSDITDGKVTGSNVSFSVVRTMNGNSVTNSYTGTVTDGAIKGKINYVNRNGEAQSRDWAATLQK